MGDFLVVRSILTPGKGDGRRGTACNGKIEVVLDRIGLHAAVAVEGGNLGTGGLDGKAVGVYPECLYREPVLLICGEFGGIGNIRGGNFPTVNLLG